jgi:hypothetical protein
LLTNHKFSLVAQVSTENPTAVKRAIQEFAPKGSVTATEGGFVVKAELRAFDPKGGLWRRRESVRSNARNSLSHQTIQEVIVRWRQLVF